MIVLYLELSKNDVRRSIIYLIFSTLSSPHPPLYHERSLIYSYFLTHIRGKSTTGSTKDQRRRGKRERTREGERERGGRGVRERETENESEQKQIESHDSNNRTFSDSFFKTKIEPELQRVPSL